MSDEEIMEAIKEVMFLAFASFIGLLIAFVFLVVICLTGYNIIAALQ